MQISESIHHRKKLYILIILLITAGLAAGLFSCISYNNSHGNQEAFAAFAMEKLEEQEPLAFQGNNETEIVYDNNFSYAVGRESSDNDAVEAFVEERLEKSLAISNNGSNASSIVKIAVRDTGKAAFSILITVSDYASNENEYILSDQRVESYLLRDNGIVMEPMQLLKADYISEASEYAEEYFRNTYNSNQLSENWRDYIEGSLSNFDCFLITEDSISFYFERGSVLREEEGTVKLNLGPYFAGRQLRQVPLDRYVDSDRPMVAISYDDGPGRESEEAILDVLAENAAVASFFYVGYRMEYGRESAERAAAMGCEIGNHSWSHPQMSRLSREQIINEINRTNDKIKEICNVEPVLARPPYGDYNQLLLDEGGMPQVMWTVDTLDWRTRNPELIFEKIKNAGNLDGQIILMHSLYEETAQASEMIIPWLKEEGYQLVTVSELIEHKTGEKPKPGNLYRRMP